MHVLEMNEYWLVVEENIHIEHFLAQIMEKNLWISSEIFKIDKNQQKITDVPHFDIKLAPYKNFWGTNTIWDQESNTKG